MIASAIDAGELETLGLASGLDACGVAAAEPFESTRRDLEERRDAGLHGGMAFTYRNPERSTDPRRALPGARAIFVGARAYDPSAPAPHPDGEPVGRVAAYARCDEYAELRAALSAVADELRSRGWKALVLADDNALVDREAARRAGIGWYGKNTNVLLPGRGSFFVLGSVLTDAPLAPRASTVEDGCGACRRCIDACPTGAIVAPGVLDARRCLAWLLQRPGVFPEHHRVALGDRIYGCDDCQEICPANRHAGAAGANPSGPAWVPLIEMLEGSDEELMARHGRWYVAERDPRWLRRNALIALGNVGAAEDPRVAAVIGRYQASGDEILVEHASWAAKRIADRAAR